MEFQGGPESMQNFSVSSLILFNKIEYQLRTSRNGRHNRIVSSLFRNAELINSKEIGVEDAEESSMFDKIKQFHENRKKEIEWYFSLSIKLETDGNAVLQNMLGAIFEKNNLHAEAIKEYIKANRRDPMNSQTYKNLGQALFGLKKYDHAIQAFEKAIELSPHYADLYNHLGAIYLEKEECRKAYDLFTEAIDINPYYAEAYLNQGIALIINKLRRQDFSLSKNYQTDLNKVFNKATQMNPSYLNKYFQESQKDLTENKLEKALENLKLTKVVGAPPSYFHEKYYYYIKLLTSDENASYELIGEYIKFLQGLLKKYPNHADIHNDLGLAYCILRNYVDKKAMSSFENALKINPKFKKARRNLRLFNYESTGAQILLQTIAFDGFKENLNNPVKLKVENIKTQNDDKEYETGNSN